MTEAFVLCYHAVSQRWPAALSVTPAQLRQHIALLGDRGYHGVTFSDAVAGPPRTKAVAITFDDAYRSVIEHALPILTETGFPATVFAPTAFIGSEEPMNWPGIDQWLDTELRHSRQEIERRLGSCRSLAYPYGDYDEGVAAAAGRAGYSAAGTLSGRRKPSGGPLDAPRVAIYHVDGGLRLRLKVSPLLRRFRASTAWAHMTAARRGVRRGGAANGSSVA